VLCCPGPFLFLPLFTNVLEEAFSEVGLSWTVWELSSVASYSWEGLNRRVLLSPSGRRTSCRRRVSPPKTARPSPTGVAGTDRLSCWSTERPPTITAGPLSCRHSSSTSPSAPSIGAVAEAAATQATTQ
jgi:hypothetical protein